MKRTIRLKESELKRMISESVRRVLNEVNTNTDISAQNKGADYFPYGVIGWSQDESDGVFDRSEVVLGDSIDDVPDYPYGIYALTREGREIYEEWCDDASVGYNLGNGRMKGLAGEIGGREWDIWNYLTSDSSLSKKVQ